MKNILICDDATFIRMLLKDILEKEGYHIEEAENGLAAVEKFKKTDLDLVIMNITMPVMNGIDALKEIIKLDPYALVIMCSAMNQQITVINSIKAGAKDFVIKPFHKDRIIEAVKRLIG